MKIKLGRPRHIQRMCVSETPQKTLRTQPAFSVVNFLICRSLSRPGLESAFEVSQIVPDVFGKVLLRLTALSFLTDLVFGIYICWIQLFLKYTFKILKVKYYA